MRLGPLRRPFPPSQTLLAFIYPRQKTTVTPGGRTLPPFFSLTVVVTTRARVPAPDRASLSTRPALRHNASPTLVSERGPSVAKRYGKGRANEEMGWSEEPGAPVGRGFQRLAWWVDGRSHFLRSATFEIRLVTMGSCLGGKATASEAGRWRNPGAKWPNGRTSCARRLTRDRSRLVTLFQRALPPHWAHSPLEGQFLRRWIRCNARTPALAEATGV